MFFLSCTIDCTGSLLTSPHESVLCLCLSWELISLSATSQDYRVWNNKTENIYTVRCVGCGSTYQYMIWSMEAFLQHIYLNNTLTALLHVTREVQLLLSTYYTYFNSLLYNVFPGKDNPWTRLTTIQRLFRIAHATFLMDRNSEGSTIARDHWHVYMHILNLIWNKPMPKNTSCLHAGPYAKCACNSIYWDNHAQRGGKLEELLSPLILDSQINEDMTCLTVT